MKKSFLLIVTLTAFALSARAGEPSSKAMAPAPCSSFYADNEWDLNIWGTYVFTDTDYAPNLWLVDITQSTSEGNPDVGTYDKYIGNDHAWGGGGDIKYFFHRYFGVGIEGMGLSAHKGGYDISEDPTVPLFTRQRTKNDRGIGAGLGTFTIRYPIACTRFAPYGWAGVGAIFGGGESDQLVTHGPADACDVFAHTRHFGSNTRLLGQFGFGLEVRLTPHIAWTNDLSWGVIDGPDNNFTAIRSGLNFAF